MTLSRQRRSECRGMILASLGFEAKWSKVTKALSTGTVSGRRGSDSIGNWILPGIRHVRHHGWSVIVIAEWLQVSRCKATQLALMIIALSLRWLANRAALEAMDQLVPPRPVLFIRLMLILKPSRFRQLF